jgi:hypothetical protein
MSGPPGHPPFEPRHEASFAEDRRALNLHGPDFDHFFADVERTLRDYPYLESVAVEEDIRMRQTRSCAPDLPPLYVYYRVQENPNRIVFLGLSQAWSKQDLQPF